MIDPKIPRLFFLIRQEWPEMEPIQAANLLHDAGEAILIGAMLGKKWDELMREIEGEVGNGET